MSYCILKNRTEPWVGHFTHWHGFCRHDPPVWRTGSHHLGSLLLHIISYFSVLHIWDVYPGSQIQHYPSCSLVSIQIWSFSLYLLFWSIRFLSVFYWQDRSCATLDPCRLKNRDLSHQLDTSHLDMVSTLIIPKFSLLLYMISLFIIPIGWRTGSWARRLTPYSLTWFLS